jgi:hypothetical protein
MPGFDMLGGSNDPSDWDDVETTQDRVRKLERWLFHTCSVLDRMPPVKLKRQALLSQELNQWFEEEKKARRSGVKEERGA